jgi:hypothetical protein
MPAKKFLVVLVGCCFHLGEVGMNMVTLPSLVGMEILKIYFQESPWLDVRLHGF